MINIEEPKHGIEAFWSKAFRVFFTAAATYAVVNMLVWLATLAWSWQPDAGQLSLFQWHAHELLWGYATAVIAGFLLTAVGNWTGHPTAAPQVLQVMLGAWLLARIGWLLGGHWLWLGATADVIFLALLNGVFIRPVWLAKQRRQGGIVAKLILLLVANLMVSASALGLVDNVYAWTEGGVFLGLFSIVGLLLTFLRRVYPFFVRAASGGKVQLSSPVWIDRASLVVFLVFLIVFFAWPGELVVALTAAALVLVLGARLVTWHDKSIWRVPLLWSLYLGLAMIVLGAALLSLSYWYPSLYFSGIHAWSMGGLGMITLGMMLRVGLGHTGRNVRQPRLWLWLSLVPMLVAVLLRIFTPILADQWVAAGFILSQISWTLAFVVMIFCLVPVFFKANQQGL